MRRRILPAVLLALALLAPSAANARVWSVNGESVGEERGFVRLLHSVESFVHHFISRWAEEGAVTVGGGK